MLESPLFQQLLVMQHSVKELSAKLKTSPPEAIGDFDFSPSGELVFADDGQPMNTVERTTVVGQSTDYAIPATQREPEILVLQNTSSDYATLSEAVAHEDNVFDVPPHVDLEFNDDNHEQIMKALSHSNFHDNEEFLQAVEALAQGREVETVKLIKPEEGGLGFSVVGLKSDNRGELGIFIQEIQPDGVSGR